jgi:hypothetical protein
MILQRSQRGFTEVRIFIANLAPNSAQTEPPSGGNLRSLPQDRASSLCSAGRDDSAELAFDTARDVLNALLTVDLAQNAAVAIVVDHRQGVL